MSDLQVDVCKVLEIKDHPNADKLEIAIVKGWEIITGIGNYKVDDEVVHIPPDCLVPDKWAEEWEVTKYLSWNKRNEGKGRVKVARLRGVPSYGFLVPNESNATLGTDLQEYYDITKWEPPLEKQGGGVNQGKNHKHHPLFFKYTDIQNIKNYPRAFEDGEFVSVTEKIHGSNSRVGYLCKQYKGVWGWFKMIWDQITNNTHEVAVGSHNVQRNPGNAGIYGTPLANENVIAMMKDITHGTREYMGINSADSVILYGEVFGPVQDLKYGSEDQVLFRAFDISIDGKYLDPETFMRLCIKWDIPHVPILYTGPYSRKIIDTLYTGKTTFDADHIREGIVIKPLDGREHPKFGRVVLKHLSPDYLTRKHGTEKH